MRLILNFLFATTLFCLAGCSGFAYSNESEAQVKSVILQCRLEIEKKTGNDLSREVDRIYVDEFKAGYTVSFSHGAVGTFGVRSVDQKSVWGCGVTDGNIVFLGNLSSPALIDQLDKYSFEDYTQDVKEYLYVREGDGLSFVACKTLTKRI